MATIPDEIIYRTSSLIESLKVVPLARTIPERQTLSASH